MTSYTVSYGKGPRGRFSPIVTLKGRAAHGIATVLAGSAPAGYRAKVEPK